MTQHSRDLVVTRKEYEEAAREAGFQDATERPYDLGLDSIDEAFLPIYFEACSGVADNLEDQAAAIREQIANYEAAYGI